MTRAQGTRRSTPSMVEALTWGAGVALGVGLGAYLTAVGGTGAPGVQALDLSETVMLPLVVGGATTVVVLAVRLVGALLRRSASHRARDDEGDK